MRSAYQHLVNRLSSDSTVTDLLPEKYNGSDEPIFSATPEDAPSTHIFIGDPVTSEDMGAKNGDSLSKRIAQDLFIHVPRTEGSASAAIILAEAVVRSLNRWTSATLEQGLNVEMSVADYGPRVDNDTHYISVVAWRGLLRQP